jgi:tRNA pseudouridine32 synthase/23S rRNA pseudouridine746 synthase
MERRKVVDETGQPINAESPYHSGAFIYYYRELEWEMPIPFEEIILYRDEHIVVADKPHFLPVIPAGKFLKETLLVRLKKRLALEYLVPLHRLDRETSGVVTFSHNPKTRAIYASLFREYKVKKVYEALAPTLSRNLFPITYRSRIVQGSPFYRMKEIEGIPNSETKVDVIREMGDISLYQLTPLTGRKHQLRVHCAALGMPIMNDKLYPDEKPFQAGNISNPLQLLAKSVSFQNPLTGQDLFIQSTRTLFHSCANQPGFS